MLLKIFLIFAAHTDVTFILTLKNKLFHQLEFNLITAQDMRNARLSHLCLPRAWNKYDKEIKWIKDETVIGLGYRKISLVFCFIRITMALSILHEKCLRKYLFLFPISFCFKSICTSNLYLAFCTKLLTWNDKIYFFVVSPFLNRYTKSFKI